MGLGDNMLYKATYIKKNGKLPFGVEVQFLSDRYKSEYFLFNGKLLPSNFEKEIVEINRSMQMDDIQVVQVLAQPVKYRGMSEPIPAFGLEDLVNKMTCLY